MRTKPHFLALAAIGLLVLAIMVPQVATAGVGEEKLTDRIRVLPPNGLTGDWLVGERVVVVDAFAKLNILNGSLQLGACVEVEGRSGSGGELIADVVTTLPTGKCPVLPPTEIDGDCGPDVDVLGVQDETVGEALEAVAHGQNPGKQRTTGQVGEDASPPQPVGKYVFLLTKSAR